MLETGCGIFYPVLRTHIENENSPTQDASILYPFVVTFGDFAKQTLRSGRQSVDQDVRICSTCFNITRTFFTYNNSEWW